MKNISKILWGGTIVISALSFGSLEVKAEEVTSSPRKIVEQWIKVYPKDLRQAADLTTVELRKGLPKEKWVQVSERALKDLFFQYQGIKILNSEVKEDRALLEGKSHVSTIFDNQVRWERFSLRLEKGRWLIDGREIVNENLLGYPITISESDYSPTLKAIENSLNSIANKKDNPWWQPAVGPILGGFIASFTALLVAGITFLVNGKREKRTEQSRINTTLTLLYHEITLRWDDLMKPALCELICEGEENKIRCLKILVTSSVSPSDLFVFEHIAKKFSDFFSIENNALLSKIVYGYILIRDFSEKLELTKEWINKIEKDGKDLCSIENDNDVPEEYKIAVLCQYKDISEKYWAMVRLFEEIKFAIEGYFPEVKEDKKIS